MSQRPRLFLLAAVLIYVTYRALVLSTAFDEVSIPVYELLFGNIGEVALGGWYGPPLTQYYDNCGGHLVVGLLTAPVFALLGPTYLALKLIPVGLGLGALVLLWSIARREFGPRAASLAALFFAIGPPTLAKYSMLAKGNHFENLFFQLLALFAFYHLHGTTPGSAARRRALWLFGLAAGFAVFFYFGSLILLALLGLTHVLVRGLRGALADLRQLVPAGILGASPLLWIQLSGGARPSTFLGSHFIGEGGAQTHEIDRVARVKELFIDFLPRGTCCEDLAGVPGALADRAYLMVFVLAWLVLGVLLARGLARVLKSHRAVDRCDLAHERRRFEDLRLLPLVGYLPAFVLLYAVSRFEFDVYLPPVEIGQFRYLVPHYTLACLVVAIAAARLYALARPASLFGGGLAAVMLGLSAFSLPIIDLSGEHTGLGLRYDGFDWRYEKSVLLRDSTVDEVTGARGWDLEKLARQLSEFPRAERQASAFGVGHWRAWALTMPPAKRATSPRPARLTLGELLEPHSTELRIPIARGAGAFLGGPGAPPPALARWLPGLVAEDHPLLPFLIEGLSMRPEFPLSRSLPRWIEMSDAIGPHLPGELRHAWWRGRGVVFGRLLVRGVPADVELVRAALARTPTAGRDEVWFGVGFGAAERLRELDVPPAWLAGAPAARHAAAYRGLGAGLRHRLGEEGAAPLFAAWRRRLDPEARAALELGLRWPAYPAPQRLPGGRSGPSKSE